jgi:hypothetical protein
MSEPRERPILFSGPMVRAVLEGRKSQTRRLLRQQPDKAPLRVGLGCPELVDRYGDGYPGPEVYAAWWEDWHQRCPFGAPGDRLWVRETWHQCPHCYRGVDSGLYRAGGLPLSSKCAAHGWRPSIHMPRWASRITLEVLAVRVERLQDIPDADVKAEGTPSRPDDTAFAVRAKFIDLWQSIHGPASWGANPWVWVVAFRRVQP